VGDYDVEAAGAVLFESDFDSVLEDDESLLLDPSDEADVLAVLSLFVASDLAASGLESVDSDSFFPLVPFL